MKGTARIIIAEDHALVREGLKSMISESGTFDIIGEAGDGGEALERTRKLHPDMVLMDLFMPGMDGIRAIEMIKAEENPPAILVLTMHKADEYIFAALDAGADGYVLKDAPASELILAMKSVLSGKKYICADIAEVIARGYLDAARSNQEPSPLATLTDREREVMRLVALGKRNKDIAGELYISVKTVEKHRANLMRKLGLHSAWELRSLWERCAGA